MRTECRFGRKTYKNAEVDTIQKRSGKLRNLYSSFFPYTELMGSKGANYSFLPITWMKRRGGEHASKLSCLGERSEPHENVRASGEAARKKARALSLNLLQPKGDCRGDCVYLSRCWNPPSLASHPLRASFPELIGSSRVDLSESRLP